MWSTRSTLPRIAATALAAVLAAAAAGCSSTGAGRGSGSGGEPPLGEVTTPGSPAEISLPLDAYQEAGQQRMAVTKAEDLLGQTCMRRFGFDWKLPRRVESERVANHRRYGLFDERLAATHGYHPIPDEAHNKAVLANKAIGISPAATAVWMGKGPSSYQGRAIPRGGCLGEATRQLQAGSDSSVLLLPERLAAESVSRAEADSRLRQAWQRWSECMRAAGYDYRTPWDVNDDPAWWDGKPPSKREIQTATTDVACRRQTNTVGIWMAVEAAYQRQLIERNAEGLAQVKRLLEVRARNAAQILAGGPLQPAAP